MKVLSRVDIPIIRVCMHVPGIARTDVRVMREATALREAGFEVVIVDIEGDQMLPAEEEIDGVSVKHIRMPGWFIPTRFKPWFLVKVVRMLFHSTTCLMQVPADIYHAHDDLALLACYIAARLRHKPIIFDAHELPLSEISTRLGWFHKLLAGLFAFLVPRCAGIITVSPPIVQEIRTRYHVSEVSLIRNVPWYRTVPKNDRLRQYLGLSPETKIALYQGFFHAKRGLSQLIRTARFLEQNIVIVLMGNGSKDMLAELQALITDLGVADRVKIIPAVPYKELLDWTVSADLGLIIYPPDSSLNVRMCLPNKLFEYLMAGVPILSSQLDAVEAIIKTYDIGRVVLSLTPQSVAAVINSILADLEALDSMAGNAKEVAQREFYWEKESQKLVQLYNTILGTRNVEGKV